MKGIQIFYILLFIVSTLLVTTGAKAQIITTIAGNGTSGYTGDGGAATAAEIDAPMCVSVDRNGNVLFYCDWRIRKVSITGIINTIAGNGTSGLSIDGVPATATQLESVYGVAADSNGNIYIADLGSDVISKINSLGIISTFAGNGLWGFGGDGGPATSASFFNTYGVAVDGSGNVYIADGNDNRIRKIDTSRIISTIAGNGTGSYSGDGGLATAAGIFHPTGVAVDDSGNVYIADRNNYRIRKVNASGIINTVAGNGTAGFSGDGGPATLAVINSWSVAVDKNGNIYIADISNNRIRKVNASGIISTFAGDGTASYSGDGGLATAAEINGPMGVAVDGSGNVYIADAGNNRIRKVSAPILPITGTTTVCIGSTITLRDSTVGGTWSSGLPGIVTIGSLTGIVTGVAVGTATISYTVSGISVIVTVSVNPLPSAGIITGAFNICVGATTTLTDTTTGGAWSSSNSSGTVSGGVVTGLSAGVDTIKYSITNGCGTAIATKTITINPLPLAGAITGVDSVCPGMNVTLSETVTGGDWSSSDTTRATVDATGVVTGITTGSDYITYTVANSCGTADSVFVINVLPVTSCPSFARSISSSPTTIKVFPNPHDGVFIILIPSITEDQVLVIITNMLGEKVKELMINTNKETQVQLHVLPGIYFLSAVTKHEILSSKIIID